MILNLKKIKEQGTFQIAFIVLLIISKIQIAQPYVILSLLFSLVLIISTIQSNQYSKYIIITIYIFIFYCLQVTDICNILILYTILESTILKHQNFFECAILAIVLGLIQAQQQFLESVIVRYLLKCLMIQIKIIIPVTSTLRFKTYYFILGFNIISAFNAFFIQKLYFQLLQSQQLTNLFIFGTISIIFTIIFVTIVSNINLPNIIRRKVFHLPPLILFPILQHIGHDIFLIALAGIFYILFILEILRFTFQEDQLDSRNILDKILKQIWKWMTKFIDQRDKFLWMTHLCLFLGMMLTYFTQQNEVSKNVSVILPIGDAFAAIIGYTYGRIKIKISGKSYQGLFAFIVTNIILLKFFQITLGCLILNGRVLLIISIIGLIETLSKQIDNLLLPLLYVLIYE